MEKNWALSVDQCQVWVLEFSVYLIDLVSILLKCHDFTRIQKGVVDHTSVQSRNNRNLVIFGIRAHKTGILNYVRTKNSISLLEKSEV